MLAVIILLGMVVFAGLHTLTATRSFKQAIRAKVGDRLYYGFYRISYNIFALLSLAPVTLSIAFSQQIIWKVPPQQQTLFIAIVGIQLTGTIGMILALMQIDLLRFAGLKQVRAYFRGDPLPLKHEPLQRKGLYRYVRHPLYFFALLSMWFVPVMTDLQLLFTLAATAYFLIGSRWEERRMVQVYGRDYIEYQQSVPWLVPFVKLQ